MPRCSHCGKVNREGSLFCQDCGHRLEAAPAAKPAASPAASGPVCASCGTANPAGMNFCKMCGTSLAQKAAPPTDGAAASGKVSCSACGKQTPAGFSFCQHCGQRLAAAPQPQVMPMPMPSPASVVQARSPISTGSGMAAAPMVNPTPPAGLPRPQVVTASRQVANDEAMAKTMAPTPEMMAQVRAQAEAARAAQAAPQTRPQPVQPQPGPQTQPQPVQPSDTLTDAASARFGSLVTVRRDGTDGETVDLFGETFDVGRAEGSLNFGEDPYLAPRHARFIHQDGKVVVRPIDAVNGVYLRVQGGCDLGPGDQFLVGKEVLRFEPLAPEERDPPSLVEHGVRYFGSAPREAWGRLRQLTIAGTTRDVWHLSRPELVLGREEGDVTFPDDEFMSRRHAAVKRVGAKARLEDLASSNGTFVRLRGDRELKPGDVLRMGDQLLRFEQ